MLEPRFTCGPDPSILCNTLKAVASVPPVAAPSLAISAWTRSSLVFTRNSPIWKHTKQAKRYHLNKTGRFINRCDILLSSRSFTSTVHRLVHRRSSTPSDTRQPFANLPQERVLDAWRHKSHSTVLNSNLYPPPKLKKKKTKQKITHITRKPTLVCARHCVTCSQPDTQQCHLSTVVSLVTYLRAGARSNIKHICVHNDHNCLNEPESDY